MFLTYGVDKDGRLIEVTRVPRGRTNLKCPYCGVGLIAKKGQVLEHHFAHDGDTCRAASRDQSVIELPIYDNFNIHLSGRELEALAEIKKDGDSHSISESILERKGVVKFNDFAGRGGKWELTHKGKIPFGELSLMLFNDVQEPLILKKHDELEKTALMARGGVDFDMALSDLKLYRAQIRRILQTSLYLLEITYSGGMLHKIGVTTRDIKERVAEIQSDLQPVLGSTKIKVLDTWEHRGNVELYFKYRYKAYQQRVGESFTEYFRFPDIGDVTRDLRRMKPKILTEVEQAILDGLPSRAETGELLPEETLSMDAWVMLCQLVNGNTPERTREADWIIVQLTNYDGGQLASLKYVNNGRDWSQKYQLSDFGRQYHAGFEPFYRRHFESIYIEEKRRNNIRAGMERAKQRGKHVGRPAGGESREAFLAKYPEVIEALRAGHSIRKISEILLISTRTVQDVKRLMDEKAPE